LPHINTKVMSSNQSWIKIIFSGSKVIKNISELKLKSPFIISEILNFHVDILCGCLKVSLAWLLWSVLWNWSFRCLQLFAIGFPDVRCCVSVATWKDFLKIMKITFWMKKLSCRKTTKKRKFLLSDLQNYLFLRLPY
jgi:hypothetical protein